MAVVVDNSVVIGWLIRSQASPYTRRVAAMAGSERFIVPPLWVTEIANVMLTYLRRRALTSLEVVELLLRIDRVGIEVDQFAVAPRILVDLGRRHQLSGYDAAYLELAQHRGLPLATRDAGLARAARAAGVPLAR